MSDEDQPKKKLPMKPENAAVPLRPPRWLDGWVPAYQVDLPKTEVQAEYERWEAACEPIDPKALAVMLDKTLEMFTPLPANWAEVYDFYLEGFEDVPADLVAVALKHVRLNCKFFPKPAEFRQPIAEALSERLATRTRLGTILKIGQFRDEGG